MILDKEKSYIGVAENSFEEQFDLIQQDKIPQRQKKVEMTNSVSEFASNDGLQKQKLFGRLLGTQDRKRCQIVSGECVEQDLLTFDHQVYCEEIDY